MKPGLIIFNTLAVKSYSVSSDTGHRIEGHCPPLPYTISSQVS